MYPVLAKGHWQTLIFFRAALEEFNRMACATHHSKREFKEKKKQKKEATRLSFVKVLST